jgi:hypothetical protein
LPAVVWQVERRGSFIGMGGARTGGSGYWIV